MKIYFCGSIKGGRQKVEFYHRIIEILMNYGEVLTEHIGDSSYVASDFATAKEVYRQDAEWLRSADVAVAEITVPSLGVGYELAYAEANKIPTLCFYEKANEKSVSSMILGDGYFKCFAYDDFSQIKRIIEEELPKL